MIVRRARVRRRVVGEMESRCSGLLKALLINHTFRATDGQGRVNAEVARALLDSGHGVTLVGRDVPPELAAHEGATVIELGPAPLPTTLLRHASFGVRSARLIRKHRTNHDLVIANGGMTFVATDVNLCHFVHASWLKSPHHPGRAHASRSHGLGSDAPGGESARLPTMTRVYQKAYAKQGVVWERNAYRRAQHVVAVSDLVKRQLIDDVGIDADKITVIENGIDPPLELDEGAGVSGRDSAREQMGVPGDAFVVFFVGDLKTPRKNLDVVLSALAQLPNQVQVVAAGGYTGGPYPRVVEAKGWSDRVTFLGMRPDVRALYAGADVLVSMSHYEPFGLVVTEAMASGVPVVVSRSVGASGAVTALDAGVVLPDENDADALAAAIERLRNEPGPAWAMGQRGRRVVETHGWGRVGRQYVALCEKLLAERQSSA